MRQTTRRLRRLGLSLLAATALSAVAAAGAGAAACRDADSTPARAGAAAATRATLCLVNRERVRHGLRRLRSDRRLALAARRHSRDMVAHRYFAHDSRSGARFSARIARTGWMHERIRWSVGENLAWGTGTRAAPRAVVAEWMASAAHRANILSARYRVAGVGIAAGTPVGAADGATYTTDFGS